MHGRSGVSGSTRRSPSVAPMTAATKPVAAPDPLETRPPSFSLEDAASIAKTVFGVEGELSFLDSERDQNLRISSVGGQSFVLKISNSADDLAAIEMQTLAM